MPQGPSFWFDTRVYLSVAAALTLIISFYNLPLALLSAILILALVLYGRERYIQGQKALSQYIEDISEQITDVSAYAVRHLPQAIVMFNYKGKITWRNHVFTTWFEENISEINTLFEEIDGNFLKEQKESFILKSEGDYFRIEHKLIEIEPEKEYFILYITNVTDTEVIRMESIAAMPVVCLIKVDNYDDVLKGLSESQRTSIVADVNQKLVEAITNLDGFLKMYTDDTYFAVINRSNLDVLLDNKFDILDIIRSIQSGNKIPVTLSMGVSAGETTIAELNNKAQAGLDLALGRGGDQAAVYIDGKVQFYGGKAKAIEKNTRVKARIVAQALRELITGSELVLIMGHSGEDFDCLGSSFGVAKLAEHRGVKHHIIVSQTSSALQKVEELLPNYEEYEGLLISEQEALNLITPNTLLFIVDTHRPELVAGPELLNKTERIVVIDHHRRSEAFINNPLLVYLEPSSSSTSELVTELIQYFDDYLDLTRLQASALYAGIIVDTKNFAVQTGVRTFEAASYLRRAGADPTMVRQMFKIDFETLRVRADIISHTELVANGFVLSVCPSYTTNAQTISAQVADMLLTVEGVMVSLVMFILDENTVGISARSQGNFNVQVLMEKLGGGGHQTVAGAQLKNISIEEAKQKLIALINESLQESGKNESDITTRSKKAW